MELDLLAVGAGACGLAAAIAAHDEGLQTAVIEKFERPGGNTALSTGSVPGAGTRFQRAAGIADSPEKMLADYRRTAGEHDVPEVMQRLIEISAPLCEWLVDRVPSRLDIITDYAHVGHSLPRLHAPGSRRGSDLLADLLGAAQRRGIPVVTGNPVNELVVDARGVPAGVVAGGGRARETRLGAKKILLACNGFAAAPDLVREYCPEIAGAQYFGARGSTGEALRWGRGLGAALANMGAYQGYAAVSTPHGQLLSWTTIEKGGILVDDSGTRFGNEARGYSGFAKDVLSRVQQGAKVYAVFDDRICRHAQREEEFKELFDYGGIKPLAEGSVFQRAIDVYNLAARGVRPDAFGRDASAMAPLVPPYWIAQVLPGLFHTQGGLKTDPDARVLAIDGRPIPNLYAGGGAAAGISGRSGALGYLSGNGLLSALGLGWLAARAAADEIRRGAF
ncbi:MAG: FAD-binding protein [Betaproteobacteria bacterium]|nr:FAD-binding protein [Betaproteobacteria bacterium]